MQSGHRGFRIVGFSLANSASGAPWGGSVHYGDTLVTPQGEKMAAVACDNIRGAADHCAFDDFVVIGVAGDGF